MYIQYLTFGLPRHPPLTPCCHLPTLFSSTIACLLLYHTPVIPSRLFPLTRRDSSPWHTGRVLRRRGACRNHGTLSPAGKRDDQYVPGKRGGKRPLGGEAGKPFKRGCASPQSPISVPTEKYNKLPREFIPLVNVLLRGSSDLAPPPSSVAPPPYPYTPSGNPH